MKRSLDNFERISLRTARPTKGSPAFTITELLIILATITFLAATLLPALAKTKFRDQYANCTANLRQWGMVCAAYASQNKQNWLPGFPIYFAAGCNLWDVSTNIAFELQPLGVTVPMFFCPVKPRDFQSIQAANPNTPITSVRQLGNLKGISNGIQGTQVYLTIFYSVYMLREINPPNGGWWPVAAARGAHYTSSVPGTMANTNLIGWPAPWPIAASDKTAAYNPIMTDRCFSTRQEPNFQTATSVAVSESGHPYGGEVANMDLLYADGHVVIHTHDQINWEWWNGSWNSENYY